MPDRPVDELDLQEVVTNLPFVLTPLVGRQADQLLLTGLLRGPDVRLVTLLGAGGVGKTRLALQVAAALFDHFPGGVYFVDLAALSDPDLVLPAIVHTLELTEDAGSALATLKRYLRPRRILLVIDNFEQVDAAATELGALLAAGLGLKMLVTSRTALRLAGEHEFFVAPLALPDLQQPAGVEELAANPAVLLFVQRAQAVKRDFQLTPANAAAVAEICVRLDGLPLAIELAAARIKILSSQALLARLVQPLPLLTGGARDLPARQQTMRATIEWSYKLLDADEQRLFRRLAVFAGGCTLEEVGSVCFEKEGSSATESSVEIASAASISSLDVQDRLASLVEKNLVVRVEQEDGEPRFMLLELIREYGMECLAASGEANWIRQRHLLYFLSLAETAEPKLTSHEQLEWLALLEQEHNNLRAAMSAGLEFSDSAELGLRLASALWWFWFARGHANESREWLEPLLARTAIDIPSAAYLQTRTTALYRTALMMCWQGDWTKAETMAKESLELANKASDSRCYVWANYALGELSLRQGKYQHARLYLEEGLKHFYALKDRRGICWSLLQLGGVDMADGDYAKANRHYEDALAQARMMGDRYNIAASLCCLGSVAQVQGNFEQSIHYLNECLRYGYTLDSRSLICDALQNLANSLQRKGNLDAARLRYIESLIMAEKLGWSGNIAYALAGLAADAKARGQFFLATQMYGCATGQNEYFPAGVDFAEQVYIEGSLASIRAQLGEQAFAEAWNIGLSLTPAEALALLNAAVVEAAPPTSEPAPPVRAALPAGLSKREAEVLHALAQGLTNAEIAESLIVSPFTVNAHLRNIYNKIGTSDRRAAIRFARDHNLA